VSYFLLEASLAAKNRRSILNVRILNGQSFQVLQIQISTLEMWKQIALKLNQVCKSIKQTKQNCYNLAHLNINTSNAC
jgi:hypothetical protein